MLENQPQGILERRIYVRPAKLGDEKMVAHILRASIAELCLDDHMGDQAVLAAWLTNKTPAHVRDWIEKSVHVLVAEENRQIVGVGGATSAGRVVLNYVAPKARFCGVSKAMLRSMEDYIRLEGHRQSTVASTRTAVRFYRSAGYVESGEPQLWAGRAAFPMSKEL